MKVATIAISLLVAGSTFPAQTPDKLQEIQKLLAAMDSAKNVEAAWNAMIPQIGAGMKALFARAIERDKGEKPENIDAAVVAFTEEVRTQFSSQQMIERMVVPMYDKNFSMEEVHQMRLFYESPVGQKRSEAQPAIMQAAVSQGQTMEQEIVGRIMADDTFRAKLEAILRCETPK